MNSDQQIRLRYERKEITKEDENTEKTPMREIFLWDTLLERKIYFSEIIKLLNAYEARISTLTSYLIDLDQAIVKKLIGSLKLFQSIRGSEDI